MDKKKSHGGHGLMMLLCCLVMFGAFWFVGTSQGGEGSSWSWLLFLLCPVMHIFMMKGMMGHKNDEDDSDSHSCH
ncbi:Protein of unknown function (DUF2933) [Orenia metallireducens]|uniref:DUF2933 domain-containing protein n=1 Tax=Orenia metallireducens TaxID=1413210 RepID=A0A285IDX7_9FIRM|nr:DUF2933 domain-containing protein [Orenia metallireducens]PRX19240.1 Protein of unknown function (DUF2933) [Orenia metallireducens]SNY46184.1 Protein of unknown function [Orenia metallireducens]